MSRTIIYIHWKLRDNDLCTFCKQNKEHTLHLFWQCDKVQEIWQQIKNLIEQRSDGNLNTVLQWSEKNVMFNLVHPKPGHIINLIVLLVKQFIYRTRCSDTNLSFQVMNHEIDSIKTIEYRIAKKKRKLVILL